MDGISRQSYHRHHTITAKNKLFTRKYTSSMQLPVKLHGHRLRQKVKRNTVSFFLEYLTLEPVVLALRLEEVPESGDSLTGLRQVLGTPEKQLKPLYIS